MKQFITFLLSFLTATSFAQVLQENMWVTNGPVYAVHRAGNTVYVGGNFTQVGPHIPCGAAISTSTGNSNLNYVKPNGLIRAVAPDGTGGWYIGGNFTQVGGQPRNRLARVNVDGSLNSWNPDANGMVYSLVVHGNSVYVGGVFTAIGGQTRNYLAEVNATSGAIANWNPNATGPINTLEVISNTIYAGGSFTAIGGQSRNNIAAIDSASGAATSWDPNANSSVYALAVSGSTIYVGGAFSKINGQTRNNIAALTVGSNSPTGWDPNTNSSVYALAVSSNTVYAGGDFTTIDGQNRNRIAALDANAIASSNYAKSWNPDANALVYKLVVDGSTIYAGGDFTTIGGQSRNRIAALDANGAGVVSSWNPNADDQVRTLAVAGSTIYIGGQFFSIGGVARHNIAAFDAISGAATSWDPNATGIPNGIVYCIATAGSIVYVGGNFTSIGGQSRNRIAALNAGGTGTATSWNPNANDAVRALAVYNDIIYAGGYFTTIGGQTRNRMAALNTEGTGTATGWNPNANNPAMTMVVNQTGSTVYVGGYFTSIGGQSRNYIAALETGSNNATSWDPSANIVGYVYTIALSGNLVYAGGAFTTMGTFARNHMAAIDITTGGTPPTPWDPNVTGNEVRSLALAGNTVYAGGFFSFIGGQSRNKIAGLDINTNTNNATLWNPSVGSAGQVWAVTAADGGLYVGGDFFEIAGQYRRFAAFDISGGTVPVNFGPIEAFIKGGELSVNWTSLTEINNHHYEIEVSADGVHFQKIGESVLSKAKNGNNSSPLHYSFNYQTGAGLMAISLLGFAAMLLSGNKRKRGWLLIMLIVLSVGYISCSKSDFDAIDRSHKKLYIRIAQVDKDGTKTYSKVVQVMFN